MRKKENSHQEKGGREGKVRVGKGEQIWKSMKQYSFKNSKARGNKYLAERNVSFPLPRLLEMWRLGRKTEEIHFKVSVYFDKENVFEKFM